MSIALRIESSLLELIGLPWKSWCRFAAALDRISPDKTKPPMVKPSEMKERRDLGNLQLSADKTVSSRDSPVFVPCHTAKALLYLNAVYERRGTR